MKHKASELNARDRACIEYGAARAALMKAYGRRHEYPFPNMERVRKLLRKARKVRARIFRECSDCVWGDDYMTFCWCNNKKVEDSRVLHEKASGCPHYEERREV